MRNARTTTIKQAVEKFDLHKKWEQTSLARKIAIKTRRASLTDFERFQVQILRQRVY